MGANEQKTGKTVIMVVEDDSILSCFLTEMLNSFGYASIAAASGTEAIKLIEAKKPSLLLLDLGLPDMDGVEVVRRVKAKLSLPIIIVSARDHGQDKVNALDAGADDYVTKPFDTPELLARIRAGLRHYNTEDSGAECGNGTYRCGKLNIDFSRHSVTVDGEQIHLTQNEYRIISMLCQNAGKVLTHKTIIEEVWGVYEPGDNKILRVNMANIRKKVEKNGSEQYFYTENGVGYRVPESEI